MVGAAGVVALNALRAAARTAAAADAAANTSALCATILLGTLGACIIILAVVAVCTYKPWRKP